jgi:Cof subfamily protein (haloacid dehalogenase superfamily)
MNTQTKIVFFDIDGTLMHNQRIPETAKEAVTLLKEQGITPVIATGRSEYEVTPIREALGIEWALTCNGAHIGHNGRTVHGRAFSRELIRDWMERADGRHTFLLYGAENMFTTNPDSPLFAQARREIGFRDPLVARAGDEMPDIYQCIVFCTEEEQREYTGGMEDNLYIHRWRIWAVDINPQGVNKATGIHTLLDLMGLKPEDAAAFGDGKNDIEMIKAVGRGIAMGNACPELLACAPYVTRHAEEDGILHGVKTLILA